MHKLIMRRNDIGRIFKKFKLEYQTHDTDAWYRSMHFNNRVNQIEFHDVSTWRIFLDTRRNYSCRRRDLFQTFSDICVQMYTGIQQTNKSWSAAMTFIKSFAISFDVKFLITHHNAILKRYKFESFRESQFIFSIATELLLVLVSVDARYVQ